ncbi:MAG TPA: alpha/beta hydrolase [Steroidobacteraceae bacterium]|jgi:pimeloyl-ACP methyl ester carboxylesterase|nr:alpha/beta hydrolase [Steroidobacteraceae bacterium]
MRMTAAWDRIIYSVQNIRVHHRVRPGDGVPLLLIHGIGPGTDCEANFGSLLSAMPADWPVHMIDLIGFGGSDRKPSQPGFDVPLWLDQIGQALDRINRPALLIGNSVGGALALKTAARGLALHGVVAIGAPAAAMELTDALRAFWSPPTSAEGLAAAMRPMTAAQLLPDQSLVAARWARFNGDYARWYGETLSRPQACLDAVALSSQEAARITVPLRLLHGQLDRACPPGPLARLVLEHLSRADLTLLGDCGHNVISERASIVLDVIEKFREKGSTL